jgi:carbonic anhydrase/acetyltransferase-like protein (isoleucine patch superfamily)
MNGPVILPYRNILPRIDPSAFIAPGVVITGDVEIGPCANIWFGCVIRGDDAPVRIGARANIQDGCVLHVTFDQIERIPCLVGDDVAVGHMALLHGCTLEAGAFVGMKATVMDRAVVESGAMVAAARPGAAAQAGQIRRIMGRHPSTVFPRAQARGDRLHTLGAAALRRACRRIPGA